MVQRRRTRDWPTSQLLPRYSPLDTEEVAFSMVLYICVHDTVPLLFADCRNWKPSLTMDSMMEIPGVQAAMKAKPVSGAGITIN